MAASGCDDSEAVERTNGPERDIAVVSQVKELGDKQLECWMDASIYTPGSAIDVGIKVIGGNPKSVSISEVLVTFRCKETSTTRRQSYNDISVGKDGEVVLKDVLHSETKTGSPSSNRFLPYCKKADFEVTIRLNSEGKSFVRTYVFLIVVERAHG